MVKQLLPIFDQLTPIYMDVAQGRQEFSPSPEETAQMLRNYYGGWSQGLEPEAWHVHKSLRLANLLLYNTTWLCSRLMCGYGCDVCLWVC